MDTLTILAGVNKEGNKEKYGSLTLRKGEIYSIVGNTGSGKSRFIRDIAEMTYGESVSKRKILIDGKYFDPDNNKSFGIVSHLSQNMRFNIDINVQDFIDLHKKCKNSNVDTDGVIKTANTITPEKISKIAHLNTLSGGQSRALMIADIALISNSRIVLIDEIENAGIDKEKALFLLQKSEKIILVVTHDPHTALAAKKRIVINNGEVICVNERNAKEEEIFKALSLQYYETRYFQDVLRKGDYLV